MPAHDVPLWQALLALSLGTFVLAFLCVLVGIRVAMIVDNARERKRRRRPPRDTGEPPHD